MARFNLNGFLDNSRFEDMIARYTGGSSGHDDLTGTTGGNALFAGGGDDNVAGMAGNDTINGGSGADNLWGGSGNDNLAGGTGNDVLVGGKKLCGLMVEAEGMPDGRLAVVAGIGTNIVAAPEGTPTPAVSLAALGVHISAEELFAAQSDAWVEFSGIWNEGRGFAEIRRLWLERAYGIGEPVAIQTGTAKLEGTFDTIDNAGCLIVRTADGRRMPVTAGEVFFGNAASVGAA